MSYNAVEVKHIEECHKSKEPEPITWETINVILLYATNKQGKLNPHKIAERINAHFLGEK